MTDGEVVARYPVAIRALVARLTDLPWSRLSCSNWRCRLVGSIAYIETAVTASAATLTDVVGPTIVPWTIAQTLPSNA